MQVVRGCLQRAATKAASVNSYIKTGLFACNRHICQDHKFACHGTANLKINVMMELAMKFQGREHRTFLSTTPVVGNLQVQQTSTHSSNRNMFCSHRSSKTIKSDLCKLLLTGSSCDSVRKRMPCRCQRKPAIKRLFETKIKRSSKKSVK